MESYSRSMFQRFWALLLCALMLLSAMPTAAFAADGNDQTSGTQSAVSTVSADPVYVLAASDFQGTYENGTHVTSAMEETIKKIVGNTGRTSFDGFLFCGDYSLGGDDIATRTEYGYGRLKAALEGYTFNNEFFITGNHDAHHNYDDEFAEPYLDNTGYYSTANYDIFCLNWADYGADASEAAVLAQANALENHLSSKEVGLKPIFVISHAPLHHSYRSIDDGDTRYGKYLVDVLNAAGQRGLNIIFLYGHNHSSGYDFYMGGTTNFVGKGETLWVTDPADVNNPAVPRTINFTYMNAGYVGQTIVQEGLDSSNTMSVFEIVGDDVTIRRYDINGEHDLQSKGGAYWEFVAGSTDAIYGIQPDTKTQGTPVRVASNDLELEVPTNLAAARFEVNSSAEISVKNPSGTYKWSLEILEGDNTATMSVDADTQSVIVNAKAEGVVKLTATNAAGASSTVYLRVVAASEEVVLESSGTFYRLVNEFTVGKKYILADRDSDGTAHYLIAAGEGTGFTTDTTAVASYRDGMPVIRYAAAGDGKETDRPIWYYEGGHLRNASRKASYLALATNAAVQLLHADDEMMTYSWSLDDGLRANVGGISNYLVYNYNTAAPNVLGPDDVDDRYHYHFYAYEETVLYAVGDVSDRTGKVAVGAAGTTETGSYVVKTWSDGRVEYIPVTMSMLSSSETGYNIYAEGVHTNLVVTYNGVELCSDYTLTVGSGKTVSVTEGYYYRLVDTFTPNGNYLIVSKNTKGDGYLMESAKDNGSVNAASVNISLDANGVPCILPGAVKFTYGTDQNGKQTCNLQSWDYETKTNFGYTLNQQNAFNTGYSNYIRAQSVVSQEMVTGRNSTGNTLKDISMQASNDIPGYTTIAAKAALLNGEQVYVDVQFYLQFAGFTWDPLNESGTAATFYAVRDYDRVLGNEVYIYEKTSYTTAEVSPLGTIGTVTKGAAATVGTGTRVQITRPDGTVELIRVTANMLFKNGAALTDADLSGVTQLTGLTLKYQGVELTSGYTLNVVDSTTADPVYPQPGGVRATKDKDTSEFDFSSTGVARIDLSTVGAAANDKVDVLVIVDTSSSMTDYGMDDGQTRLDVLRTSVEELIEILSRPNVDGTLPDIDMCITQFNNYNYFSNVNALNNHTAAAKGNVHPDNNKTIKNWTDIYEMQNFNTAEIKAYACTNYDVAFEHAYKMLEYKQEENAKAGETRKQVVIFMTDGICYQYNYLSNVNKADEDPMWERWLMGTLDEDGLVSSAVPAAAQKWYHPEGKQWTAEAIKGDPTKTYPIIRKTDYAYEVGGDYVEATHYKQVPGLGATMYTIGFGLEVDGPKSREIGEHILTVIASDSTKYFCATDAADLSKAFNHIAHSVRSGTTGAVLYDTLGAAFDLQMGVVKNSNGVEQTFKPTITINSYDMITVADIGTVVNGVTVTEDMVGTRKSNTPCSVLEVVTFNDDGTEAYSNQLSGNILQDGIIKAKYFQYNTNKNAMGTMPGAEQFVWDIGDITEHELVMSYYVYLENSMGEDNIGVAAGGYDTNAYAVLEYIDTNGKEKEHEFGSPVLNWAESGYSYGFYLVDERGVPMRDANGNFIQIGSVTDVDMNLNVDAGTGIPTAPAGYTLFDPNASYTIHVNSGVTQDESQIGGKDPDELTWDNGGKWDIGGTTGTTYVYYNNDSGKTNLDAERTAGNFHGTTAWFAVMRTDLVTDKKVSDAGDGDPNTFELTLEAYSVGGQITVTKPSDIVLVLDRSASMHTPAGAAAVLKSGVWYGGSGAITKDQLDETKGLHLGYYVAQSTSTKTWFYLRYNPDNNGGRWEGYSVLDTEAFVNPDEKHVTAEEAPTATTTQHIQKQDWTYEGLPATLVYYKSQYAILYDSVLKFVADLKNSGVEHRVALVGFAGAWLQRTQIYISDAKEGMVKTYSTLYNLTNPDNKVTAQRRNELYQLAMKNVQNATQYDELLAAIEAFETNNSFTCPAAGIHLGTDVFNANAVDMTRRDRIMILFTDGIPNSMLPTFNADGSVNAEYPGAYDGDAAVKNQTSWMYNQIVAKASEAKGLGAHIYTVSTSTLGDGSRDFLHYASSDYPYAYTMDETGTEIGNPRYAKEASDFTQLSNIFSTITKETTVELDSTTVLRETLSDYFTFNEGEGIESVEVYAVPYNGATKSFDEDTKQQLSGINVSITCTEADCDHTDCDRPDLIEVTGFDYKTEYISDIQRTLADGSKTYGRKLVVKVKIKTRDGFWGGNNVPTNENTTAIYTPDGKIVEEFPIPQVNVPVDVTVNVEDKTYYYGTNGKTGSDLEPTVKVNGKDVIIDGDDLKPTEDWMNDFTTIQWDSDSSKPSTIVDGRNPADYTFSVTVTPNTTGESNTTPDPDKPGNIVGTPVVPEGVTGEDKGHVYILVPELTFKDSHTDYNTPTDNYDYPGKDYVSENWVESTGKNPGEYPAVDGEKPTLDLTYTPEGGKPTFTTDTKVDVTVKLGDEDITDKVIFKWEKCDHDVSIIPEHTGDENHNEFWVHVIRVVDLKPDTVVIDFGLDVVIDVLANDNITPGLVYSMTEIALSDGSNASAESVSGSFGTLKLEVVDGKQVVRYCPNQNSMLMNVEDVFRYYVVADNGTILRDTTVTVIPATIIYYEDNFGSITYEAHAFNSKNADDNTPDSQWSEMPALSGTQAQDRPGEDNLPAPDANNIYGYDGAYTSMSANSMDTAMKFTASQDAGGKVTYGTATFTFNGTGFDVISVTSGYTGTITVQVMHEETKDGQTSWVSDKKLVVDTYYGYKYENGQWVVEDTEAGGDALYQVPVIKVSGLEYGTYKAIITVSYNDFFNHNQYGTVKQYDFYLDAIRIYDPANDGKGNDVIEGAYKADGEGWPEYFELRNLIIARGDLNYSTDGGSTVVNGVVFIDNSLATDEFDVADYRNFGPNNELYLAPGQSITFDLDAPDGHAAIHLAMKSVGNTAKVKLYTLENGKLVEFALKVGDTTVTEIATATDLYYDISDLDGKTVVIRNNGAASDAVLSITNVKITYESEHTDSLEQSYFTVYASKVMDVLNSFNKTREETDLPTTNGGIVMKGATLSLEDEVLMNFYFQLGKDADGKQLIDMSSVEEIGLLTWTSLSAAEKGTYGNADGIVKGHVYDAENNRYMVHTTGIAAKNMGDDLYARVYMRKTDGTYIYGDIVTYSPKTYAYNRLADKNSNMHDLCVALLNYGAAAQVYFGYKTNDLMNAQLSAEQRQINYNADLFTGAKATDDSKTGNFTKTSTGFTREGATVSFDSAFAINYYFTPSSTVSGDVTFYYWTSDDYTSATILTAANASGIVTMRNNGTGNYWTQISGIAAKEIDSTFYAAAVYTDAGGNTYCTGVNAYSLSTYCINKAADGNEFATLAQATAMYGYYAAQYFASVGG